MAQVACEARALAIPISPQVNPHVQVNRRALSRFGCCYQRKDGFLIELAESLLVAPERSCRQTLAHELLHTCPGCLNHGPAWKAYAKTVGEALGLSITRAVELEGDAAPLRREEMKYFLRCEKCGAVIGRYRMCKLVKYPWRYRCAACGGKLKRV